MTGERNITLDTGSINHENYLKLVDYIDNNGKIIDGAPSIYKVKEITLADSNGIPQYKNVKLEINAHSSWAIGRKTKEEIEAINESRRKSVKGLMDIVLSNEATPSKPI